jgi:hypothetical protein
MPKNRQKLHEKLLPVCYQMCFLAHQGAPCASVKEPAAIIMRSNQRPNAEAAKKKAEKKYNPAVVRIRMKAKIFFHFFAKYKLFVLGNEKIAKPTEKAKAKTRNHKEQR